MSARTKPSPSRLSPVYRHDSKIFYVFKLDLPGVTTPAKFATIQPTTDPFFLQHHRTTHFESDINYRRSPNSTTRKLSGSGSNKADFVSWPSKLGATDQGSPLGRSALHCLIGFISRRSRPRRPVAICIQYGAAAASSARRPGLRRRLWQLRQLSPAAARTGTITGLTPAVIAGILIRTLRARSRVDCEDKRAKRLRLLAGELC